MLRLALSQIRTWAEAGRSIPVAVNISARACSTQVPCSCTGTSGCSDVAPYLLCLELTETAVMADYDLAFVVLQALDTMGVSLSFDDFGTGYSSMSYLKTLPVTELKIDRSFVMAMTNDPDSAVIVRSAVDLGARPWHDRRRGGRRGPHYSETTWPTWAATSCRDTRSAGRSQPAELEQWMVRSGGTEDPVHVRPGVFPGRLVKQVRSGNVPSAVQT